MPTREVLFRMERDGVLIDGALLAAQSRELGERIMELEQQAFQEAGQPFNLASPKQLGEILFNRMKLPVVKKTATGQPSTDEDVLQQLAADYPLPKLLLEHRGLSKLKSTYTDKLPQMVNPRTGRVHTNFGQATAVTGRLASTDPNLQNIPVRTAEGTAHREAFIAPPDHVHAYRRTTRRSNCASWRILSADAVACSRRSPQGPISTARPRPRYSASRIDQVTAEQRRYIKAVNFGLIYGMSAFGLAAQLGIERARRSSSSTSISRAIPAWRNTCSARASSRGGRDSSKRSSGAACGCRTSTPVAARAGRAPSARRSTRRCRAPPRTSSSSR